MTAPAASRNVEGELTFETVPQLYAASAGWFEGSGDLVIDLGGVTRADSAGLGLMIEWLRRAGTAGRGLRFVNISAHMQTLIRVYGLQDALTNHAD